MNLMTAGTTRMPGDAKLLNISFCGNGKLSGYAGSEMIAIFTLPGS